METFTKKEMELQQRLGRKIQVIEADGGRRFSELFVTFARVLFQSSGTVENTP